MKKLLSMLSGIGLWYVMFCSGCTPPALSRTAFQSVERPDAVKSSTVLRPEVKPMPETIQHQKKGSMVVSVEIVPFEMVKTASKEERVVASDDPDFDKFEIATSATHSYTPNTLRFKIRVKNGQDRILKLDEVLIDFRVDAFATSVDGTNYLEWKTGMITPGTEKEYLVPGPQLSSLPDSCIVGIFLYDMPTAYNKAGEVTSKDNYHWFFKVIKSTSTIEELVHYTYEKRPTYKEVCSQCKGLGKYAATCSGCGGTGKVKNNTGNLVTHFNCSGSGKVNKDCPNCVQGKIAHRQSGDPVVNEQWSGYRVNVLTKPAGVQVHIMDPETHVYAFVGESNCAVDWWMSCSKDPSRKYPIKLVYEGVTVNVLGMNANNVAIKTIQVDFSQPEPVVMKGRKIDNPPGFNTND